MVVDAAQLAEQRERAERNAETRDRLLDGVIHIASTRGLDKVTSRAVGAQTGLSHSLVRFYFGTVDAMIVAALERAAQLDVAEGHLLADDIEVFGSHIAEAISQNQARGMLQFDYLLRAVRGGVPVERVARLYDYYQSQIAGTLQNLRIDDPDGALAALIFAALDGLVLQHAIHDSAERTDRALDRLRQVLRMLQPDAPETSNTA